MRTLLFVILTAASFLSAAAQDPALSLSEALRLARQNRPGVAAAEQRLQSAELNRKALGSYPGLRLSLGYTTPLATGGSDEDLVLAQPLDVFGRGAAARALAGADRKRAEAELRGVHASIQASVLEQYNEAAAARALLSNAEQTQEIAQRLFDAIQALVREGRTPGVQLTRVSIELERSRLLVIERRASLDASQRRLSGLLNVSAETRAVTGFAEVPTGRVDRESLQRDRSDLLLLAAEVQAAEAEARMVRLGSLPELEVQGRRTPWQESDPQFGFRVQLNIPIFDYGRTRAQAGAANLRAQALRKQLEDASLLAQSEVAAALIELDAARQQVRGFEAIRESARLLLERSNTGFREGAVTLIELLEATRSAREVEESMVQAQLRLARAQARYLASSGRLLEVRL